jgi:dihydropteroate synthase/2-amino-4-hydroxy-6-hydroxymethyldihydropteridine diphosphokinase
VRIEAVSPVYETPPWGPVEQPDYYNLCLRGETALGAADLLAAVKAIETAMGRSEAVRYGPRLIDIDVLFYDDLVLDRIGLTIPHPRVQERSFVLVPLSDIAPDLMHPVLRQTITALREQAPPAAIQRVDIRLWPGGPDGSEPGRSEWRRSMPFRWGARTYVMGILNVTPDSFSGDGLASRDEIVSAALAQARQFVADGADILDVGGESTRPGSTPVTADEEMARILPVIRALRREMDAVISVDTYRAAVAEAALAAGADWVNDVWGLRMDPEMGPLAAHTGCPVILMHNRSKPKDVAQEERLGGRYVGIEYDDVVVDVTGELKQLVEAAIAAGVGRGQIILDPGIGFGKTVPQNVRLIRELDRIKALGYPLLLGPSRKSFIGYTLNLPVEERLEGTAAAVAIGIDRGADIIRVHDVKAMVRVARMTDALSRETAIGEGA